MRGHDDIQIFAGNSTPSMTEAVGRFLQVPLGKSRVTRFSRSLSRSPSACARSAAVATRSDVRPKSVSSCDADTPAATRSRMIGLFRPPAAMRLPFSASAPVTLP